MYTLKDLSLYGLRRAYCLYPIMTIYHLKTYEDLKEIINSGAKDFQDPSFRKYLEEAYKSLDKIIKSEKELPIYPSKIYESRGLNPNVLKSFEESLNAEVLPLTSPLNVSWTTNDRINDYSIADIRSMLETATLGAKNGLTIVPNIGISKILRIYEALQFFEEQMVRLATTCDYENYEGNLFYKDLEAKRKIILSDLKNILITLFNMSNAFVWGTHEAESKEQIISLTNNPRSKRAVLVREKIVSYLSNYMILEDLENKDTLKRALTRFI
ncbi:MAG: hypothetical protein NC483_05450 [Ruminococcus sp.]|nr:hypothetical protein [Ruminococcus sp.]